MVLGAVGGRDVQHQVVDVEPDHQFSRLARQEGRRRGAGIAMRHALDAVRQRPQDQGAWRQAGRAVCGEPRGDGGCRNQPVFGPRRRIGTLPGRFRARRSDRQQQREEQAAAQHPGHADPVVRDMADALRMRAVAVWRERDLFAVAAAALARVADERRHAQGFRTGGIRPEEGRLRAVEIQRDGNGQGICQIGKQAPAVSLEVHDRHLRFPGSPRRHYSRWDPASRGRHGPDAEPAAPRAV